MILKVPHVSVWVLQTQHKTRAGCRKFWGKVISGSGESETGKGEEPVKYVEWLAAVCNRGSLLLETLRELRRTHRRILLQGKPGIAICSTPISHGLRAAPWDQELSHTSQTFASCREEALSQGSWEAQALEIMLPAVRASPPAAAAAAAQRLKGCGTARKRGRHTSLI